MSAALPGARFSLPFKLTALAALTQAITLIGLLAIADQPWEMWLRAAAFAALLVPPLFIIYFLTRFIFERVTSPLVDAYRRVGEGDFTAKLPPTTAGAEFVPLREAFAGMALALERSVNALRDADLERRQLFADLAHELATPTTTLLGIAHALRVGEGEPSHLLQLFEHETARLERLIADVREVAHVEDPQLEMDVADHDLSALAVRAVDRAKLAQVDIGFELDASSPAIAAVDALRIDQIFVNLIANAVRYAPRGSGPARVAVGVTLDGQRAKLVVEDSGPGVPETMLSQLGKRLVRIEPSRSRDTGGHGLGLAIVRAIVERHRGEMRFGRSKLGGLSVEISLRR